MLILKTYILNLLAHSRQLVTI